MMEPPFFNSHYQTTTPLRFRRAPVRRRSIPTQTPPPCQPRKVVSIPIHFVNSMNRRFDAAVRIQKTFRGFRVRKPVKKILELKREVDAVEKKLQERETMEVIMRDGMERLKVNENLMALLFRLDSVRGFNDEIRGFRKAVIRKAILLQELIDSAIDDGGAVEERDSEGIAGDNLANSEGIVENVDDSTAMYVENSAKIEEETETVINNETLENNSDEVKEDTDNVAEGLDDSTKMQVEESAKTTEEAEFETHAASDDTWECVGGETEEQKSDFVQAGEKDDHEGAENRESKRNSPGKGSLNEVGGEEKEKRKKEKLLERMAEDNQRLMTMVADLCQKNTVQTSLICSLWQRVEHLEKAMNDRLRKKKKKLNAALM